MNYEFWLYHYHPFSPFCLTSFMINEKMKNIFEKFIVVISQGTTLIVCSFRYLRYFQYSIIPLQREEPKNDLSQEKSGATARVVLLSRRSYEFHDPFLKLQRAPSQRTVIKFAVVYLTLIFADTTRKEICRDDLLWLTALPHLKQKDLKSAYLDKQGFGGG